MARVFLISEAALKKNSVINNNVDGMYILPAIEYAQDAGLQPLLGTKLYNKLMDLVDNGAITGVTDYKYLLDEYCHISRKNKNKISIFMYKNKPFFNKSSKNSEQSDLI